MEKCVANCNSLADCGTFAPDEQGTPGRGSPGSGHTEKRSGPRSGPVRRSTPVAPAARIHFDPLSAAISDLYVALTGRAHRPRAREE